MARYLSDPTVEVQEILSSQNDASDWAARLRWRNKSADQGRLVERAENQKGDCATRYVCSKMEYGVEYRKNNHVLLDMVGG